MLVHDKKVITAGRRKCWGFSKGWSSAFSEVGKFKLVFDSFFSSHLETRNLFLLRLSDKLHCWFRCRNVQCVYICVLFRFTVRTVLLHLVSSSEFSFAESFMEKCKSQSFFLFGLHERIMECKISVTNIVNPNPKGVEVGTSAREWDGMSWGTAEGRLESKAMKSLE